MRYAQQSVGLSSAGGQWVAGVATLDLTVEMDAADVTRMRCFAHLPAQTITGTVSLTFDAYDMHGYGGLAPRTLATGTALMSAQTPNAPGGAAKSYHSADFSGILGTRVRVVFHLTRSSTSTSPTFYFGCNGKSLPADGVIG